MTENIERENLKPVVSSGSKELAPENKLIHAKIFFIMFE